MRPAHRPWREEVRHRRQARPSRRRRRHCLQWQSTRPRTAHACKTPPALASAMQCAIEPAPRWFRSPTRLQVHVARRGLRVPPATGRPIDRAGPACRPAARRQCRRRCRDGRGTCAMPDRCPPRHAAPPARPRGRARWRCRRMRATRPGRWRPAPAAQTRRRAHRSSASAIATDCRQAANHHARPAPAPRAPTHACATHEYPRLRSADRPAPRATRATRARAFPRRPCG